MSDEFISVDRFSRDEYVQAIGNPDGESYDEENGQLGFCIGCIHIEEARELLQHCMERGGLLRSEVHTLQEHLNTHGLIAPDPPLATILHQLGITLKDEHRI